MYKRFPQSLNILNGIDLANLNCTLILALLRHTRFCLHFCPGWSNNGIRIIPYHTILRVQIKSYVTIWGERAPTRDPGPRALSVLLPTDKKKEHSPPLLLSQANYTVSIVSFRERQTV